MEGSSRKSVNVEMFLNKSHIRSFANSKNKHISQQAIVFLNGIIKKRIIVAIERMGSRKTIMWDDIN